MNRTYNTLLILIMGTGTCFAGTMGSENNSIRQAISFSAQAAWYDAGQTQTFFLQPDVQKTYSADNSSQVLGNFELFYGFQKSLNRNILGQLGIAGTATTQAKLSGDIWEDANPQYDNYNYSYQINHYDISLKTKLLFDLKSLFIPYLSGKVGLGFNKAKSFSIEPKIFPEIPAPGFGSHTSTAFSYAVGIGVQKELLNNLQVGVGYEFADWGNSHLEAAPGQTINSGLQLNHLYTNGLQLSLNYII